MLLSISSKALCLAPTYELALQIGKVAQTMGQFIEGLKIRYSIRGQTGNHCTN